MTLSWGMCLPDSCHAEDIEGLLNLGMFPADIKCENDVVLTSMRRDYVASTLIRRHFDTKCPLCYYRFIKITHICQISHTEITSQTVVVQGVKFSIEQDIQSIGA